jgi:hypothetical protein
MQGEGTNVEPPLQNAFCLYFFQVQTLLLYVMDLQGLWKHSHI